MIFARKRNELNEQFLYEIQLFYAFFMLTVVINISFFFFVFFFTLFMANFQFDKFVNMSAESILASGLLRTSKNTIFKRLTTPTKVNNIDSQVFFFRSSLMFEYDDDDSTVKVQMCVRHTFY